MVEVRRKEVNMRSIMWAALAGIIVAGGSTGALAQRVGVEIYADEPYYEYGYREPRAYRSDRPRVVIPIRPANCGEFRYWNGERCVDARFVPPDIR
jgi:hypothetical protein